MKSAVDLLAEILQRKDHELEKATKIKAQTLRTIRSRFSKNEISVSYENWCRLAQGCGIDPTVALIALLRHEVADSGGRIGDADLRKLVSEALEGLTRDLVADTAGQTTRATQRTLANFPDAFEGPFVIVTGDRREVSGNRLRMTPADFGILSSSPADLRFLYHLGLPPRATELVTDKIFALAPFEELQRRFAEKTLIVIGSPASNHLARIVNQFALHRFNLPPHISSGQEDIIREAWEVGTAGTKDRWPAKPGAPAPFFTAPRRASTFDCDALKKLLNDKQTEMKWLYNAVFAMGLIDPAYHQLVRGLNKHEVNDFGVITLAQNPFRSENDGKYPAVLLAGYHLPATCYALHPDIWSNRHWFFADHLYGGIIQVSLKANLGVEQRSEYTFYERIENFKVAWDDSSAYQPDDLRKGLEKLSKEGPRSCFMTEDQAQRAAVFLNNLRRRGD